MVVHPSARATAGRAPAARTDSRAGSPRSIPAGRSARDPAAQAGPTTGEIARRRTGAPRCGARGPAGWRGQGRTGRPNRPGTRSRTPRAPRSSARACLRRGWLTRSRAGGRAVVASPQAIQLEETARDDTEAKAGRRAGDAGEVLDRDLRDPQPCLSRGHAQLDGNAGAVRTESEAADRDAVQQLETAVDVVHDEAEGESTQPIPRAPRPDASPLVGASRAQTDDDLGVVGKRNEFGELFGIELVVTVHLEDPRLARGGETAPEGGAVAAVATVRDDASPRLARFHGGTVAGPIIDHDDLDMTREPRRRGTRSLDRASDIAPLVQGWQDDGDALQAACHHTQHHPAGGGISRVTGPLWAAETAGLQALKNIRPSHSRHGTGLPTRSGRKN